MKNKNQNPFPLTLYISTLAYNAWEIGDKLKSCQQYYLLFSLSNHYCCRISTLLKLKLADEI